MTSYKELITVVQENHSYLEHWLVFADKLQGDGNAHGEAIASDIGLRQGNMTGKDAQKVRKFLLNERKNIWHNYGLTEVPDYFLQNQFWMGSFLLKFPNTEKLEDLTGAFAEDFPHYELLPLTNTYARGVHQLRKVCETEEKSSQPTFSRGDNQTIYRPFTFRETILARVEDFYTLYDENGNKRSDDQRLRLFNTWLDSCTGIAYKTDSPQFKIILQSPHLIGINENFNQACITEELTGGMLEYDSLRGEGVIELDQNRGRYNQLLTLEQVLDQPAWNAAVEEDKPLLKEYTNIVFSQRQGNNMSFWLRDTIEQDQLRAVFVYNLNSDSDAGGNSYLIDSGSFLRR